jgi:hypothetical protein
MIDLEGDWSKIYWSGNPTVSIVVTYQYVFRR